MSMIKIKANGTTATIEETERLTSGRVGLPISLDLSEEWDGLLVTVVCSASGVVKDVPVLPGGDLTVPHECLAKAGVRLTIGVYGATQDGHIVIPTIYADAGKIHRGADPSGEEEHDPTPSEVEQILAAASEAVEIAQSVRNDADAGEFDGPPGADGPRGPAGVGVPRGGTTGQVLKKQSDTDYDTEWADESGGGQDVQNFQKSGHDLDEQRDVVTGAIYQCVSDHITSHSNISNDTQFHKGYFYLFNGYSTQYYYTRTDTQPIPTKTSDLTNDSGFLSSSQVDVNSVKPYDYEQTYTIPNNIVSGSTVRVEFAHNLREFSLEITTPETVISAGTGYFYLTLDNGNGGGRFWEPALGQNHASKLCVSFTKGRDGIYRLDGYKYDLTNNSDYSLMVTYNSLARQNIGRLFLENPRPIASIYFTSGGDISQLAGTTIKVRGLKC